MKRLSLPSWLTRLPSWLRRGRVADAGATAVNSASALLSPVARADRFGFADLLMEATAGIGSRPGRLVMTILGTVLGIGSLIATIGFAQAAAGLEVSPGDPQGAIQLNTAGIDQQPGQPVLAGMARAARRNSSCGAAPSMISAFVRPRVSSLPLSVLVL